MLKVLMQDHNLAMEEYQQQFETQVEASFLAKPGVKELLLEYASVFIPANWTGINGLPAISLPWIESLIPKERKVKVRYPSPALLEAAAAEVKRLIDTGMYIPSSSPIQSQLTIAPKKTPPFVRACGNYIYINKLMQCPTYPIPNVKYELAKLQGFSCFADLDWMNAFHQLLLDATSSARLSLVTPWGHIQPKFVSEGISPASGMLQQVVFELFKDFEDWTVAIFDNLLVLAHNHDDLLSKLELIFRRCKERNVILKFKKSFIGFNEVIFFGYKCRKNSYTMSEEKTAAIGKIPFPINLTQMRSFLGSANFFKDLVPQYVDYIGPLYQCTTTNFTFDSPAIEKYTPIFEQAKEKLVNCHSLFYPDFSLEWILYTDASEIGVSGSLWQITKDNVKQPIAHISHKLSLQAQSWKTGELECFAIYYAVLKLDYYLRCKPFTLLTDHNNLLQMEQSKSNKVIRWVAYLQNFVFKIMHIAGKNNTLADMLSRLFPVATTHTLSSVKEKGKEIEMSYNDIMLASHRPMNICRGFKTSYVNLKKIYPESDITANEMKNFIESCGHCLKTRLHMTYAVQPVIKTLTHEGDTVRTAISWDILELPMDQNGNKYIVVIRNTISKLTDLYPIKNKEAETVATCLFLFVSTYGLCNFIRYDQGSEFTAEVTQSLQKYLGFTNRVALINRPQSHGTERTNSSIIRFLISINSSERNKHDWSNPVNLASIKYVLNSSYNRETNTNAFNLTFGDIDQQFLKLPEQSTPEETNEIIQKIHHQLSKVRKEYDDWRRIEDKKRQSINPKVAAVYQPGDMVRAITKEHTSCLGNASSRLDKLTPVFRGPYEVLKHDRGSNDVQVRHMSTMKLYTIHSSWLDIFTCKNKNEAVKLASLDEDSFVVARILAYKGEPDRRTKMQFLVEFEDGMQLWLPYSSDDLAATEAYKLFINTDPALMLLRYDVKQGAAMKKKINQEKIGFKTNEVSYWHVRTMGNDAWYQQMPIPDKDAINHYIKCIYGDEISRNRINAYFPIMDATWEVTNFHVVTQGWKRSLGDKDILIEDQFFSNGKNQELGKYLQSFR